MSPPCLVIGLTREQVREGIAQFEFFYIESSEKLTRAQIGAQYKPYYRFNTRRVLV